MIELTNTHQWEDEPVIDNINCWKNKNELQDRLLETFAIKMCMRGMYNEYKIYLLRDLAQNIWRVDHTCSRHRDEHDCK